MRFKVWILVAIVALAATSCVGTPEQSTAVRSVRCEVAQSVRESITMSTYPGKVYAAKEVNRAFRVAGVVESIVVKEGDYVGEGALIATMDSRDYELQLAATQAEYDAIKGEVDRIIQLYNDESVSANNYDKAVNGLKQIEAKLESHRNALVDTKLTAPFAGYIQKIYFDRGATVSAGMPIISIVSASAPEVIINIPASEYIRRDELCAAVAKCELFADREFMLKHLGTTHKANLNQLYEARFSLSSQDGMTLSPGMSVMVSLDYGTQNDVVVSIPFCAVVERDGASKVWILESGSVALREVTIDHVSTDGRAVVTRGIAVGDMVITAGLNSLKEGQQVNPLPQKTDSNIGNIL